MENLINLVDITRQSKNKGFSQLFLIIIVALISVGLVGAGVWYWFQQEIKKIEDYDKKLIMLKPKITLTPSPTSSPSPSPTADTTRPTVSFVGEMKRFSSNWQFQFSEAMDQTTITAGNINLYAVGLSIGTAGEKSLSNDILNEYGLSYNETDYTLTINLSVNPDLLICASCTWELEFTDQVKDLAGNSLVAKTFQIED